jgi:hypothetical protein
MLLADGLDVAQGDLVGEILDLFLGFGQLIIHD